MKKQTAAFAMGCFWSPQLLFSKVSGVLKTKVGYMGGDKKFQNPSYEEVCSDKTGHAEAVWIEFDADKVEYSDLLKLFWGNHNPTTMNSQGPDVGNQYRSSIFYYSESQKKEAESSLKTEQKRWKDKIVTEIVKAGRFFPAEDYHQDYLKKRGRTSC